MVESRIASRFVQAMCCQIVDVDVVDVVVDVGETCAMDIRHTKSGIIDLDPLLYSRQWF